MKIAHEFINIIVCILLSHFTTFKVHCITVCHVARERAGCQTGCVGAPLQIIMRCSAEERLSPHMGTAVQESKMDPAPDFGYDTYKGCGRLKGKVCMSSIFLPPH